jgi:dipeptidyl aminopeptidase/acylaminoacyl peptidase
MVNRTTAILIVALFLFPLMSGGHCSAAGEQRHVITPEDYFDLASVDDCAVSPGGRYAAYQETRWGEESKTHDLWVVELNSGEVQRLSFDGLGGDNPTWDPQERWIYVSGSRTRGAGAQPPWDGSTQVWRLSPAGGDPFPVTRVKGGIKLFRLGADGRSLYYTAGEEAYEEDWRDLRQTFPGLEYGHGVSELDSLWKLDLDNWRSQLLQPAERVIHDVAVSADGGRAAMITTSDEELIFKEGWSRVDVIDLASRRTTTLTRPGWREEHPSPFGWLEELAWSADGDALAFSISYDGYTSRIYLGEWEGGEVSLRRITLPPEVMFAGGLVWRGAHRTLSYRGESRARIRVVSVTDVISGGQGVYSTLTPGDIVVDSFSFAAGGSPLVAAAGGPGEFGDLLLFAEDGTSRRVTSVNPQTASWDLPQLSVYRWTGADGDPVEGILELPPGYSPEQGPLPLVVEIHGGPTSATRYRLRYWIYGRTLLAANGYALLSPNYHGSTGYGSQFLEKLIGRENDVEVTDIIAGVDALVLDGTADPRRVGVMGWSNGGYLTNCLITAKPEMWKAASSGAGVLDMVIQWGMEDTPGHVINYMRGLPWEQPAAYRHGSPLFLLDRVKTPTLIHVGGADPRVPPAHSRALYRALHHYLGVPTELVVYPGEAHSLAGREHRLAKMKWDLAWFGKYLPAVNGDDP